MAVWLSSPIVVDLHPGSVWLAKLLEQHKYVEQDA
jgi:hypothetical protein